MKRDYENKMQSDKMLEAEKKNSEEKKGDSPSGKMTDIQKSLLNLAAK